MIRRPSSLKDVADQSGSLAEFGRNLRDWLHALRAITSRQQAEAALAVEPPMLRKMFLHGHVADVWLAAYAEHLAGKVGIAPPAWAFASWRVSKEPLFDEGATPALRVIALRDSPLAFKRRNVFTPSVDLPISLPAGRPTKSLEEKRRSNAERQRRYRKARADELKDLRQSARKSIKAAKL